MSTTSAMPTVTGIAFEATTDESAYRVDESGQVTAHLLGSDHHGIKSGWFAGVSLGPSVAGLPGAQARVPQPGERFLIAGFHNGAMVFQTAPMLTVTAG